MYSLPSPEIIAYLLQFRY